MSAAAVDPGQVQPLAPRGRIGMLTLILSETTFFLTFVMVYLFYIGKSASGPQPADVLELPILNTACLLSSSLTIAFALRALRNDRVAGFNAWMALTIVLGLEFLVGTAVEWRTLMADHGLYIGTNLFGTTYYALVGFHAFHVTLGLLLLTLVLSLALLGHVRARFFEHIELLSWYWHFVDGIWVLVLTTVYVIGVRGG